MEKNNFKTIAFKGKHKIKRKNIKPLTPQHVRHQNQASCYTCSRLHHHQNPYNPFHVHEHQLDHNNFLARQHRIFQHQARRYQHQQLTYPPFVTDYRNTSPDQPQYTLLHKNYLQLPKTMFNIQLCEIIQSLKTKKATTN